MNGALVPSEIFCVKNRFLFVEFLICSPQTHFQQFWKFFRAHVVFGIMPAARKLDNLAANGFVKNSEALFAVGFVVVCGKQNDLFHARTDILIDGIFVKSFSSRVVLIGNLPRRDKDELCYVFFRITQPPDEKRAPARVPDKNGTFPYLAFFEFFFKFFVVGSPRFRK